ncbi:MAG: tRNA (N(6)-L-threonylcarbamoyladenosine(37)-C(2))-methylthiotransferase MtaB [Bacteroidaceae bacterium]|nr:tRNA (N(6)-L-threonylcarbamoyladenosine(37)-C(2))-methylthiotransferase MtaB [Bacteroidaceae bacterium]
MSNISPFTGKLAAYYTLGCKLNFAETSTIGQQLKAVGVRTAHSGERADICVINTCSVTEVADHKCRQAIHRLARQHPGAFIVVTGCYAQLKPDQVSGIEGVDLVLGANEKGDILRYLEERLSIPGEERASLSHDWHTVRTKEITRFMPSCSRGERTRFFLKVQDGCDYYCTYCTIPFARGRSRNGSIKSIVEQAKKAVTEGGKEIVITGVNIGDFGRTTNEQFIDLLRELDKVEGIERYRISSIEPNLLTDEIIAFCAQSRAFMPHFHIPLQSGSDEVLRLMHRKYDTALFRKKVELVLSLMPDAFIGVDVIVGTRGETTEAFEESVRFIESLQIAQLHVFSYSERPGTAALRIPNPVSPEEKHERSTRLIAISEEKTRLFYERFIGESRPVLLERGRKPGLLSGHTDNYIRVECTAGDRLRDNTIHHLRLGEWNEKHDSLIGSSII